MTNTAVQSDINETTTCLAEIILRKYKENTSGTLKGYLVMDDARGVITKKERKNYSAFGGNGTVVSCFGSIKCSNTKPYTRSLTAMVIAYSVRNKLMEIFRDYPFEKFEIQLDSYPEYRYEQNRIIKYRKTGDDVSFLKIDMRW